MKQKYLFYRNRLSDVCKLLTYLLYREDIFVSYISRANQYKYLTIYRLWRIVGAMKTLFAAQSHVLCGCLKHCKRIRRRKRQCKLSDRRKRVGYLPLVATSRSIVWASVPCASQAQASGDHRPISKSASQSCAAPSNWVSTWSILLTLMGQRSVSCSLQKPSTPIQKI